MTYQYITARDQALAIEQARASFVAITTCKAAKGRETLAMSLSAHTIVTPEQATVILEAIPSNCPPAADVVAKIMSSPHAEGRKPLASALKNEPGMTLEKAERIMSGVPVQSGNYGDAFCRFMDAESCEAAGMDGFESGMSSEAAGLAQALRQL